MTDKVSIIVPSYNHIRYLSELFESIRNQTYKNIEVIVLDDGSIDGSPEYLKSVFEKYNLKLVLKQNEGLCATLNKGLSLATGAYIVIIASDDFIPGDRIESQVRIMNESGCDVIAGGMTSVSQNSEKIKYISPLKTGPINLQQMLKRNYIFAPTAMIRAEVFKKYGLYDPTHIIEDYPLWLKILKGGGKISNYNCNWAYYRKEPSLSVKKIEWYTSGLLQALNMFSKEYDLKKRIERTKFKALVKVALTEGCFKTEMTRKWLSEQRGPQRLLIYVTASLPKFIKRVLAIVLGI